MNDQDQSTLGSSSRGRAPLPASQVVERLRARTKASDRYESKGEIARGGMGAIHRVFDQDLRRTLAMKVMLDVEAREMESASQASATSRRAARFLEEAQITGQLDHPGIVPVHEMGLDDQGRLFFTMKLVKGRDLREILDLLREGKEDWNRTRALNVLLRVCEAMAFAHEKGVIHRDLKPANIMVGRFGEVYVMDWGLAKVLGRPDTHDVRLAVPDASRSIVRTERKERADVEPDSSLATMDGDVVGTPCYMAPEQAKGRLDDIGPHSDVYSVGSMLYQVLSGQMPYVAQGEKVSPHTVLGLLIQGPPKPVAESAKEVPDELVAICEKAMARDVRDRYPSMLGVAEDLRAFLEGRVVKAHETGAVAEFKKWIARNRGFATAVAAAIVAVLALSGAIAWQQIEAKESLKVERDRALEAEQTATTAKNEAEAQRDTAKKAQQLADQKTLALSIASAEVERRSYAANIAAAAANVRFHDLDAARRRLDACTEPLRGWEWNYLNELRNGAAGELGRFVQEGDHQFAISVNVVAADASGRVLAAAADSTGPFGVGTGRRSTVRLFDLERGTALGECEDLEGYVLAIAFDTAGQRLFALSTDRKVRVFDTKTRQLAASWSEPKGLTRALAVAPDGKSLLYGTNERTLSLVDAANGTLLRELGDRNGLMQCAAFSPDGSRVAAGTLDGNVYVWSPATGALERTFGDRSAGIACLAFSPDSLTLAAGTAGNDFAAYGQRRSMADSLREWDIASGRLLNMWHDHEDALTWCGYAGGGRWLVSASNDSTVRVRDTQYGDDSVLNGHFGPVRGAAVVAGNELVTGGTDGILRRWDLALGEHLGLHGHRQGVAQFRFLSDGERLVVAAGDNTVRVWNARTGEMLQYLSRLQSPGFTVIRARSIATSESGAVVAIGYSDGRVRVEDVDLRTPVVELPAQEREEVTALAFAPDGARLAAGDPGGNVRIWDLSKREIVATLRGNATSISALCWSVDGTKLFVGTVESELSQWDVAEIERIGLVEHFGSARISIERSADGNTLLVQCNPNEAQLVRASDLAIERKLAIEADVAELRWFDQGRRIVSVTRSHSVGVVDAASGETLVVLHAPEEAYGIDVDPRGRWIAARYEEGGTVRVWSSEAPAERNEARRAVMRARELARPYVARLFEEQRLAPEAAAESIRRDESISEALRTAALRLVEISRGEKMFLRYESWEASRSSKGLAGERELALWRALTLEVMDPQDERAVFLEAAARFRLGQLERAWELLQRAGELRGTTRVPVDVQGIQALVLWRLGRRDEAVAELAKMRAALTQNAVQAASVPNQELLREVEAVVRSTP